MNLRRGEIVQRLIEYRAIALLVVGIVLAVLFVPYFATEQNITQVLTQYAPEGIITVGITILMIAWGLDLSVGSTMALGGTVFALTQNLGVPLSALLGVLAGVLVGVVNGLAVTRLKVNFFIATLATMVAVRGLVLEVSDNKTIYGSVPDFTWMGQAKIGFVEFPFLAFAVIALIALFIMTQTRLGTYWYAIGGNPDAARRAGLPVDLLYGLAFVVAGLCSGVGGVLLASRASSAAPGVGRDTAIFVISATVIGGTSLFGGAGNIAGAVAGVLLLGIIRNSINLLGISPFWPWVVQGTILVAVVLLDVYLHPFSKTA